MRNRLPLLFSLAAVACGGAPSGVALPGGTSTPHRLPAPGASNVASAEPSPDVDPRQADACIAAASPAALPAFIAPGGSNAFRREMPRRVTELACCLTTARRRELRGGQLDVSFEPLTDDPADGARAVLRGPVAPHRPEEARCLQAVTSHWVMRSAPVSDIVRVPLDPRQGLRSDAASVTFRMRWPEP